MHLTTEGRYGPGTFVDKTFTPVPKECERLLKWLASITPGFTTDQKILEAVKFEGDEYPNIPGPVKSLALTAVLHAMAAIVGQEIAEMRGHKTGQITINTDQVGLWLATPILVKLNGKGAAEMMKSVEMNKVVPITDKGIFDTPLRFRALGIDPEAPGIKTKDQAYALIQAAVRKYTARELEMIFREIGACGVTCFTPEAWRKTGMGISLARHPLISYEKEAYVPDTPPPAFSVTADKRPLAGIKVVELARVIAAPALCAGLAALGADVVRIMSPNAPDVSDLQVTLTVGKRECSADLNTKEGREALHKLFEDADVIVQGYRRRSLERKGFGLRDLLQMATRRGKGIVYIDELRILPLKFSSSLFTTRSLHHPAHATAQNCFGPDGIYAEVPGWQQIADAASGCCYVMGKAYGFPEVTGVLPSLPIADLSTGAVGIVTTMMAIRDRAKTGGSYHGNVALTAYQAVSLLPEVGLYTPDIVTKLQKRFEWAPMTPDLHVEELLMVILEAWEEKTKLLDREEFFVEFSDSPYGGTLRILGPVIQYHNKEASPRWLSSPKPYRSDKRIGFSDDS